MVDEATAILAGLTIGVVIGLIIAVLLLRMQKQRAHTEKIQYGEETAEKSLKQSRATIKGKVGEQIASLVPGFLYNHADVRFLGPPADLIVFDGLSDENSEVNVVFVEVKTGKKPRLNDNETRVKDAIDNKRVRWELFRLDLHESESSVLVEKSP